MGTRVNIFFVLTSSYLRMSTLLKALSRVHVFYYKALVANVPKTGEAMPELVVFERILPAQST